MSWRMIIYPAHDLGQHIEGSLVSFSLSNSLSSGVGEQAIPVSGLTYAKQKVGLTGALHRPIDRGNKKQREVLGI